MYSLCIQEFSFRQYFVQSIHLWLSMMAPAFGCLKICGAAAVLCCSPPPSHNCLVICKGNILWRIWLVYALDWNDLWNEKRLAKLLFKCLSCRIKWRAAQVQFSLPCNPECVCVRSMCNLRLCTVQCRSVSLFLGSGFVQARTQNAEGRDEEAAGRCIENKNGLPTKGVPRQAGQKTGKGDPNENKYTRTT